jgi:LysM repeat protein
VKGTLRLALAVCLIAIPALAAASETAPEVVITSPEEGLTLASQTVTVVATFAAQEDAVVEAVELVIDNATIEARAIDPPQAGGTVSFIWAARDHADGDHTMCVRAIDSHGEVGKTTITVLLQRELPRPGEGVRIVSPADEATVSGEQRVQVEIDEPELARYVIFLIDDVFKAMSNVQPFTYMWDTTRYLNGPHALKAKAYLGGQWEAISPVVRVNVNNPSGPTAMRAPKPAASPMEGPARAGTPTFPPAMRTESPTPMPAPVAVPDQEVAVPGTAPFVSPSGDLITPAAPALPQPTATFEPIEVAALPPAAQTAPVPVGMPLGPAASADVASIPAADVLAAPALSARPPTAAPLEIALLSAEPVHSPAPAAPEAPATDAPLAAETRTPAQAPLEVALLEVEAAPALSLPPAEVAPAPAVIEAVPAADAQVVEATPPATADIEIAMLPPRPVERKPAPRVTAEPLPAPVEVVYVVQSGDWLNRIAAEVGVTANEIARANNLENPSLLRPGQTLVIPTASLYFDRRPVISEVPTVIVAGQAITPFRPVIEEAGGQVMWDGSERRASALARGHEIAVTIGSDQAQVDGGQVAMGAPAALRSDRTVVPLRFLGDALDLVLQYEDGIIHLASRY